MGVLVFARKGKAHVNELEQDLAEGRVRQTQDGVILAVRDTSWQPVDLGPVLRGEHRPLEPVYLQRSDGQALMYPSAPHVFFGESETLKSWAAHLAAKSFIDAGKRVLYLDFESNDVTFVRNARQVGIADGFIGSAYAYMRPDEPLYRLDRSGQLIPNEDAMFHLEWARQELRPALIILDGVSECYAVHGWNINDATHAAHFANVFGRWDDDTASIAIDHAGKDASRGQIGSQHKRAGIDGAQFEFTSEQRQGICGHSIARIRVKKDRPGAIRAFAPDERLGKIHVTNDAVWIDPWEEVDVEAGTELRRRRILLFVRDNPGVKRRALEDGAGGFSRGVRSDIDALVLQGLIRVEDGPRGAKLHFLTDSGAAVAAESGLAVAASPVSGAATAAPHTEYAARMPTQPQLDDVYGGGNG
jgi:AAA domain